MNACPHCQRGTHLQNGVHMGEIEMHKCDRELTLEPMTDTPALWEFWHQPARRTDLPFTCGGKA
jgi:uncharacterized protein (DUF983 family)